MNENVTESHRINPFFEPYNTPHDTVPFDKIKLEDFEEAFMEGIRRDDEQIEKTINNPDKPTFDNTIINVDEDKDGYYDLLSRVSTVFSNLLSAETNDELDALAQKMQPILTKHANDVRLNKRLFERVKAVHRHHRRLTPEEKRLLDNCYDGFVRSGALLDDDGKERLRKLTEEAGMLSLQFSQNLLKENKAYKLHITDETQLDGLPETAREAAAVAAKEQGVDGWVFTLDYPSYSPFMTYATDRELRKQMYMARNTVCTHDNSENNIEICKRLVNLRREIAQLLGCKTYADYVLKHRMAGNARNVYKLLDDLIDAYKPTALKEVADIEAAVEEYLSSDASIAAAESAAAAARKDVSVNRQGWIPKLEVGYRRNTAIREAEHGFLVGGSIPIFSNHRKVATAKARSVAASSALNSVRLQSEAEVRSILTEIRQTESALSAYDEPLMRETLSLLQKAVESCEISLIDYFVETSSIYSNLTSCITLRNNYHKLMARLYKNRL